TFPLRQPAQPRSAVVSRRVLRSCDGHDVAVLAQPGHPPLRALCHKHGMPRPGFDYWLSFRGQGVYLNPVLNENGKSLTRTGYITDLLTEYATNWIRRPHAKPFVLVIG